jgi:PAS domain S-box-containing protein
MTDRENKELRHLMDKVEEALRESENKFHLLFEQSPDPVLLVEDDKFTACNEAALKILHRSDRNMLLGLRPSQISPEVQPDGQRSSDKEKVFFSLAAKDGHAHFEWVHRTFDGKDFWVNVSLTMIPVRGRLVTHVAWGDITDKKQAEENLKRTEAKYRSIFENAVNGIFQTTPDGQFISANQALATMYGYGSPMGMLGTIVNIEDQYVNPEDRAKLRQFLENHNSIDKFETELYRKNRSKIWVSVNARAVRDTAGQIIYHEGFVEDITQRKMVEDALRKEKEALFTILNNDLMGVVLSDQAGAYLYVNQEFTNVTGYTRQDVPTGMDFFQKAYPDPLYRRKVLKGWQNIKRTKSGEYLDLEFNIICKDGQAKDIEFRSTALKDYTITVLKDVTKRKQAEKALQESEEKFRLLFDKSADPIFLLDKMRFIDCNEAALTLMRCSHKNQLLGLRPYDISPKLQSDGSESVEKTRKVVRVALKEGTTHFEWTLRRFDEEEILVDGSFTVIRLQGKKILYTVWRDITDHKRSVDALVVAEEKYRNIFENATEGIFQTAVEGSLLSANPAFARLFGYESPEEMLNLVKDVTYEIYIDPARRIELKRLLDKQGFVYNFEVQCRRKDGSITWISTNMKVVRGSDKKTLFYEGTMTDITERKSIQEDLENKSRSLEEANAALNVLLRHREQDSNELEEKVVTNIKELVLPYVDRLKASKHDTIQDIVNIIESNLGEVMSPFIKRMASMYENFSPREIKVADLIKKGKTTKEISSVLGLSIRTIDIHRFNLRKKLNLNKRKVNLQSYLLSISGLPSR